MIRKFNYTGRKRLKRDRVNISVVDDKPFRSFTASVDLAGLGLPDNATVYIEPYHKSSFMRFPFGSVSQEVKPPNTYLSDIPSLVTVRFRVKVVDETKKLGRILRLADKIKPRNLDSTSNHKSILWIDWDQDLDQEIFRVSFKTDYPTLEINKKVENGKELLKTDQLFRSLVFPVVMKEVAKEIAGSHDEFEDGDDSWQSTWLKFIRDVLHVNIDTDFDDKADDELDHWVEEVVASFCRANKFRNKFQQALNNRK
jgi:hypothetical protein